MNMHCRLKWSKRHGRRRIPLSFERLESRVAPAIFTVTSLADAGPGSLRQAVADAAALAGADTIDFAAALTGHVLLQSELENSPARVR
jgi:hypothetical protein